jgi:methanogenic corrinoid protein MtbC1
MGGNDAMRDEVIREIGKAYAAAMLSGDEVAAEMAIRDALDAELTTAEIDDEVIAPALWLIGELWQRGEVSVGAEHLATEITLRVLALQREATRTAASRKGARAMLAAPAGELHVVALRMAGIVLGETGYDVLMLGPDVPAHALASTAVEHEPDVVCLSTTMPDLGDGLLLTIHELQRDWPRAGVVVGGRGISRRLRSLPGIAICDRVGEVVEAADALLKRADWN